MKPTVEKLKESLVWQRTCFDAAATARAENRLHFANVLLQSVRREAKAILALLSRPKKKPRPAATGSGSVNGSNSVSTSRANVNVTGSANVPNSATASASNKAEVL